MNKNDVIKDFISIIEKAFMELHVQNKRQITRIFVHCTASLQEEYTDAKLLKEFKDKGWKNPGYHYVVRPDGSIFSCLAEDKVSNGVQGYNSNSLNVAYVGGITKSNTKGIDNRTESQKTALLGLLQVLRNKYPTAYIMGHRDISPDTNNNGIVDPWERVKQCPCFDATTEYASLNEGLKQPKK